MGTDYDRIASAYDARYTHNDYPGVAKAVLQFACAAPSRVLELGCGTGHWLSMLTANGCPAFGVDTSAMMLRKARERTPSRLLRARAEELPFADRTFDRVLIVNALHHFTNAPRALREARRVLRDDGAVMTIGLDPSARLDRWCIYDFFEGTRAHDLERYPPTAEIRSWMTQAGFEAEPTYVAELIDKREPAEQALAKGTLSKSFTSQLTDLPDEVYDRGIAAIRRASQQERRKGAVMQLEAQLHLFACVGRVSVPM